MASNGGHIGGVESMLGTLLETSELDGNTKPLPPKDMHRIIMHTLAAHGLHSTVQCLRSEADLHDLPSAAPSSAERVHRTARAQEEAGAPGAHAQHVSQERARVAACSEGVAEQRRRLDELRSQVQQLREARGGIIAIAKPASGSELQSRRIEELKVEIEQLKDMELPSREELRAKAEEAMVLKQLLSTKMSVETDLRHKLQLAKEEVARLRRENDS